MPFRDDLLTPISSTAPSGANLRYDPVRDQIKEARRAEMEAPQGAWKTELKTADWKVVVKLAGDSIAQRSKDLQLAVWLVDAQVRTEGFSSLAPGFDFLRLLLEGFWDSLHPEIEDGDVEERAAPLSWLGLKLEEPLRLLPLVNGGFSWANYRESLLVGFEAEATTQELRRKREQAISEGKISGEQWREAAQTTPKAACDKLNAELSAAAISLDQLTGTCDKLFGVDAPSFSKTRTAIQEISSLVASFPNAKVSPVVAAVPSSPPAPLSAVPATASSSPAPAATKAPESEPIKITPQAAPVLPTGIDPVDLADAETRLGAICRFLRQKDTYDITPFLILRGLRFGQIRYNGPDKIDERMLEEPPTELRSEIERLAAAEKWDDLLNATERAMELPCGRGWLDIQRYTVKALEEKGEWWAFVADAIKAEVRGLLTDMPQLLEMKLGEDMPTADAETRKWLQRQVMQSPIQKAGAASQISDTQAAADIPQLEAAKLENAEDHIFQSALKEANADRLSEALNILSKQLASELSGRGRFLRRIQLAHVLLASGQTKVALPILCELMSEIEKRSLETWESGPALAYPLSLLLQCLQGEENSDTQRTEVYGRLCRLDPVRALSLAK